MIERPPGPLSDEQIAVLLVRHVTGRGRREEFADIPPPSFYVEEITHISDPRVEDIYGVLSHPDNATHFAEKTRNPSDVQKRIVQKNLHVLAIHDNAGEFIGTATIDDTPPHEDDEEITQIMMHGVGLFAVRRDLQSDRLQGGRTGSRAAEAVLRYAFEDSLTFTGERREDVYLRVNRDVPGAERMERIIRNHGGKGSWVRPRILKRVNKTTKEVTRSAGQEFTISFFDWIKLRLNDETETLRVESDPINPDALQYFIDQSRDHDRCERKLGRPPQ